MTEQQERNLKKCRFCAEMILDEAIKCRYCGERVKATDLTEEKIIFESKPALRAYTKWIMLGFLTLIIVVGLFFFLYVIIDRMGRRYTVTNTRVIVRMGIFSKRVDEINIVDIRSVKVRQSFLDRIVGCGNINIGTAGTASHEIRISGVLKPVEFKDAIATQKNILLF